MADENGGYLPRFERVEKTLEQAALLTIARYVGAEQSRGSELVRTHAVKRSRAT